MLHTNQVLFFFFDSIQFIIQFNCILVGSRNENTSKFLMAGICAFTKQEHLSLMIQS